MSNKKLTLNTECNFLEKDSDVYDFPLSPASTKGEPNRFSKTPTPYDIKKCQKLVSQKAREYPLFFYSRITLILLYITIFFGSTYNLVTKTLSSQIITIMVAYFIANSVFLGYHLQVHTLFVNTRMNEQDVKSIIGFLHHYIGRTGLSDNWLAHRLSYLTGFDNLTFYGVLYAMMGWNIWSCLLPYLLFWLNMVGVAHEWYHLTNKERLNHFPGWYPICIVFEKIGIINTQYHRRHHDHNLSSLKEVSHWFDMWVPSFLDIIVEWYWQNTKWINNNYGKTVANNYFFMNSFAIMLSVSWLGKQILQTIEF